MSHAIRGWDDLDQPRPVDDKEPTSALAVWGVIAGLLLPIAGLVIALILFVRGQVGPGLAACLASFLGLIFSLAFLL